MLERWSDYCERNWLNDGGDLFPPEKKVKLFLDGIAYFLLLGQTDGIVTGYKDLMNGKREIPVSSCPSYVENMLYASGASADEVSDEENRTFKMMCDELDERAAKVQPQKKKKTVHPRQYQKYQMIRADNRGAAITFAIVDTDGYFVINDKRYRVTSDAYAPKQTKYGELYDMDRIISCGERFYDMNLDPVTVEEV